MLNNLYKGLRKGDKRLFLRRTMAVISLSLSLLFVPYTIFKYFTTSRYFKSIIIIPDSPYNELIANSIQSKLNLSSNLFQMELLITAGLAGLLIAKDGEARFVLGDRPEKTMFICASSLLLLSYIFHYLYFTEVSYIYAVAGRLNEKENPSIPDPLDPTIDFLFSYQLYYLVFGFVIAAFTFFSAYIIRGGRKQ